MSATVVITGGSSGIGRAITDAFLGAGFTVLVGAREERGIQKLGQKNIIFHAMDVRDEMAHFAIAEAISRTGRLDAWINNAGVSAWKPIGDIDEKFFDELMGINLKGAFWGCKAASEHLATTGGSIVNISSIAGKRGSATMLCIVQQNLE